MISFSDSGPRPKCYATHGTFPLDLRPDKPPQAKKPFSNILAHPWYHTVDLILPVELLSIVEDAIEREAQSLHYSRVHMKLEELIDGDFFNVYIKSGNIEMLSQGPPTVETQYSLCEGILRLDVPKHIFQRLGLDGKSIPSGGRKHVPSRMRIETNLRLPSMVSGRKGFERIRWAFQNVLNESITWLFRDCSTPTTKASSTDQDSRPIAKFHPLSRSAHPPTKSTLDHVLVPDLSSPPRDPALLSSYLRSDDSYDIVEWLSLISAQSPRISSADDIDPYLCRYAVAAPEGSLAISVTTLRWHGFIPAAWLCKIVALCAAVFQGRTKAWFAVNARAMALEMGNERKDGWCLLYPVLNETPNATTQDGDADESMVVDVSGQVSSARTQASVAADTTTPMQRKERDFVLWDFVDCVTQR